MMRALVLLAVATTGLAGPVSRAADGAGHYDAVAPHHVEIEQLPASEGRPRYPSLARRDSEPLRLRGLDETLRAADDDPISKAHSPTEFLRNTAYAGTVSVGGQEFKMILDTGSSDTWVVTSSFQCYDDFGRRATPDFCGFGALYNGSYTPFRSVAPFAIQYVDGTQAAGIVGNANVSIAGLSSPNQTLAFVEAASWIGDGETSGVLGLAYEITERVFTTTDRRLWYAGSSAQILYDTVFTSLWKANQTPPVFSMTVEEKGKKGFLAFGGRPPVDVKGEMARTQIRIVQSDGLPALTKYPSYYTIVPDDFVLGNVSAANATNMPPYRNLYWNASSPSPPISSIFKPAPAPLPHQFPVIIDSGTTLSFLPPSVVRRYASQVPGVGEAGGIYWAPCGTKMPPFGIVIGGRTFLWDASDVLIQDMREFFVGRDGQLAEFCGIGLMDLLPEGPYVLGDNFLKGLVTVFDVGMGEVRLYEKA